MPNLPDCHGKKSLPGLWDSNSLDGSKNKLVRVPAEMPSFTIPCGIEEADDGSRSNPFEDGTAVGIHPASPKIHLVQHYQEALDLTVHCIKSSFDQPRIIRTYKHLQDLLFKAIKGEDFEPELQHVQGRQLPGQ